MNELLQLWTDHGAGALAGAGAVGLLCLLAALLWAKTRKTRLRPGLIWLSANLALLLNAEGMYEVLTQKADLPPGFVWLVFAVFEIMLLNGEAQVAERYRATTDRDGDGKVVRAGEPGPMLSVVWTVAAVSGLIVAGNAGSFTEGVLRLSLPFLVVWMWWATLTAEGYTSRRSRFAHTPRRILERRGWLIADRDEDLERIAHQRRVDRAVKLIDAIDVGGKKVDKFRAEFRTLARTLSDEDEAAIDAQVKRTRRIVTRYATVGAMPGELGEAIPEEQGEDMPGQGAEDIPAGRGEVMPGEGFPGPMVYWPAPAQADRAYGPEAPEHIAEYRRKVEAWERHAADERARREQAERKAEEAQRRIAEAERQREERERQDREKASEPRSDQDLMAAYGDQLVKERGENGELTVYRVRKVCGVADRQGKRLHAMVLARYASQDGDKGAQDEAVEALAEAINAATDGVS